tara:strand:- start:632 stop:1024 length:393 start_codon:yes stop_codon:yes gene_type:complete
MKIETINRQSIDVIRKAIDNALQQTEKDLGVKIKFGNARYDYDRVRFPNVEVSLENAKSKEEKDLEWVLKMYDHIDTNKIADVGNHKFSIVGYNVKAKKNNWVVLDHVSNKKYVMPMDSVERHFRKEITQ